METCVMKPTSADTFPTVPTPDTARGTDGKDLTVPEVWALLLPGDPGLTRASTGYYVRGYERRR